MSCSTRSLSSTSVRVLIQDRLPISLFRQSAQSFLSLLEELWLSTGIPYSSLWRNQRNRDMPPGQKREVFMDFPVLRTLDAFATWMLWFSNSSTFLPSGTVYWLQMTDNNQTGKTLKANRLTIICFINSWNYLDSWKWQRDKTITQESSVSLSKTSQVNLQMFAFNRTLKNSWISPLTDSKIYSPIPNKSTFWRTLLVAKLVQWWSAKTAATSDKETKISSIFHWKWRIRRVSMMDSKSSLLEKSSVISNARLVTSESM